MSGGLKITLRAGERIFVNGAVLKMDRKVGVELMNDVTFLLEQHFIKPEETTTPLRQLYFMVQTMLIDPSLYMKAKSLAVESLHSLLAAVKDAEIRAGLTVVNEFLDSERPFDALKTVRQLLPREATILDPGKLNLAPAKEVA
jgi:flagellar biosynthesis repressor protein FlbT